MEGSLYLLVRPLDLGRDKIIPSSQCAAIWQGQQVFIHRGNSANAQSACGLNQTHSSKGTECGEVLPRIEGCLQKYLI